MSSIIRALSVAVVLVLASGCAVANGPADECPGFTACAAEASSLIECGQNGQCSCITSHHGENRAVSCSFGKPNSETKATNVD